MMAEVQQVDGLTRGMRFIGDVLGIRKRRVSLRALVEGARSDLVQAKRCREEAEDAGECVIESLEDTSTGESDGAGDVAAHP